MLRLVRAMFARRPGPTECASWTVRVIRGRLYLPRAVRILPTGDIIETGPVAQADASDAAAVRDAILSTIQAGVIEVSSAEGRNMSSRPGPMSQLLGPGNPGPTLFWEITRVRAAYRVTAVHRVGPLFKDDPEGLVVERSISPEEVATLTANAIAASVTPRPQAEGRRR